MNNVAEHCAPSDPADLRCGAPFFGRPSEGKDQFDYGFVTNVPPISPEAANVLDYDVSSGVDFPEIPRQQGQETSAISADRSFDANRRVEFILSDDSPARGAANQITLRGGIDWPAQEDWTSKAQDAGAVQGTKPFVGPAFAHLRNPHYVAPPRLVALETEGEYLITVFSPPLAGPNSSLGAAIVQLRSGAEVVAQPVTVSGRRVQLEV